MLKISYCVLQSGGTPTFWFSLPVVRQNFYGLPNQGIGLSEKWELKPEPLLFPVPTEQPPSHLTEKHNNVCTFQEKQTLLEIITYTFKVDKSN